MMKKRIIFNTYIILIFTFLVSCEGMRFSDGFVLDKDTHQPIDSVKCTVTEIPDHVYTDSSGHYEIDGAFGGCMFGCKDMTVEYEKPGYKTKTELNPGNATIYLEKK